MLQARPLWPRSAACSAALPRRARRDQRAPDPGGAALCPCHPQTGPDPSLPPPRLGMCPAGRGLQGCTRSSWPRVQRRVCLGITGQPIASFDAAELRPLRRRVPGAGVNSLTWASLRATVASCLLHQGLRVGTPSPHVVGAACLEDLSGRQGETLPLGAPQAACSQVVVTESLGAGGGRCRGGPLRASQAGRGWPGCVPRCSTAGQEPPRGSLRLLVEPTSRRWGWRAWF